MLGCNPSRWTGVGGQCQPRPHRGLILRFPTGRSGSLPWSQALLPWLKSSRSQRLTGAQAISKGSQGISLKGSQARRPPSRQTPCDMRRCRGIRPTRRFGVGTWPCDRRPQIRSIGRQQCEVVFGSTGQLLDTRVALTVRSSSTRSSFSSNDCAERFLSFSCVAFGF